MNRVPELDGLRGIAVILVILFHAGTPYASGGFIGVDLFFCLSGYLITRLLVEEYQRNGNISFSRFLMRRVLRLTPALLLFLAVMLAYTALTFSPKRFHCAVQEVLYALFYISNWVRAFEYQKLPLLGHTWSLSVEEQFYLIWPPLILALLHLKLKKRTSILIITSLLIVVWIWRAYLTHSGASIPRLYNGFDVHCDLLLSGSLLGYAHVSFKQEIDKLIIRNYFSFSTILFGSIATLFIYTMFGNYKDLQLYYWQFVAISLCYTILLLAAVTFPTKHPLRMLLKIPLLVWIGQISYGIYLWHAPIFQILVEQKFTWLQVLTVGTIISTICASLSFYLVENRFIRMKKKYATK